MDTQKAAQQMVDTAAELRKLVEQFRIKDASSPTDLEEKFPLKARAVRA